VELAKHYGSENSSSFVNGVLGTIYKSMTEPAGQKSNKV
jgi:transcription termination factor NusB